MNAGIKPTESELEILQIMWNKGQCTVREVHEELEKTKEAGYTTTLKLMQIMFEKGLLQRDASEKTHKYTAVFTREQAQKSALDKIIATVFKGSASDLVLQALGRHNTSAKEIEEIKKYLDQFEQNKK